MLVVRLPDTKQPRIAIKECETGLNKMSKLQNIENGSNHAVHGNNRGFWSLNHAWYEKHMLFYLQGMVQEKSFLLLESVSLPQFERLAMCFELIRFSYICQFVTYLYSDIYFRE